MSVDALLRNADSGQSELCSCYTATVEYIEMPYATTNRQACKYSYRRVDQTSFHQAIIASLRVVSVCRSADGDLVPAEMLPNTRQCLS